MPISDESNVVDLSYIDDVTSALSAEMVNVTPGGCRFADELPSHKISLGELANTLYGFKAHRSTLLLTDFSDPFMRALYATYLSYLLEDDFAYALDIKCDERGSLAEFIKLPQMGQIFVSRTKPGITRGNHYHHTKTEKFFVLQGQGIIRFRKIGGTQIVEYPVNGVEYRWLTFLQDTPIRLKILAMMNWLRFSGQVKYLTRLTLILLSSQWCKKISTDHNNS